VTEVVGTAEHYAEFVRLCRNRIERLGVPFDTLDCICGFADGFIGKLMCGQKAMSVYSFFTLARALALLPQFAHDETQLAELRKREDWIAVRRRGPQFRRKRNGGTVRFQNHIDFYRQIGRKGAIAWNAKRMRRRAAARIAARARWGNGHTK
jgi:hypothetical protein